MALDLLAVQFVKVKYEMTRYWCDHHDHQDHHDRHDQFTETFFLEFPKIQGIFMLHFDR